MSGNDHTCKTINDENMIFQVDIAGFYPNDVRLAFYSLECKVFAQTFRRNFGTNTLR
jgi:hypothetical protein